MVFERGFATQTLSQRPKVKPLLRKGFTFGLLKFASLTRTDVNNKKTLPHLLTPQQSLRWSDLMPLLSWQLWLARQLVIDHPLPWQKPQTNLTFGRFTQGFTSLLVRIDSPAFHPKSLGKFLGWNSGRKLSPFPRFPIVKKRPFPHKKGN